MRKAGDFPSSDTAQVFSDFLLTQGIENEVRTGSSNTCSIWIHDEADLAPAKKFLAEYHADPENSRYTDSFIHAEQLRNLAREEDEASRRRTYDRKRLWSSGPLSGNTPLTNLLIGVCILVSILSGLGSDLNSIRALFISEYSIPVESVILRFQYGLPEIHHGQVWRLFTPMFIHFNLLHLFFNMLWLRDLGGIIERANGRLSLGLMVLVLALSSNLLQFAFEGPNFGGMSGVVYGLFGYIWIRGRYDLSAGMYLQQSIVSSMIVWYLLCLTGILGNVANFAHTGGLIGGMIWGYFAGIRGRR